MRKLSLKSALIFMLSASALHAAEVSFTATIDRDQIGQDESVALKLTIEAEGTQSASEPRFQAPDFDVINEYRSTFIKSFYENGHFGMRNTVQITKVLRPNKIGTFLIQGIEVDVSGKTFRAPNLTVRVSAGGAGSPPPSSSRGGSPGIGLRGSNKRQGGPNFFLRAEVNRSRVYKGEQIVVSYYLYRRTRIFNIQADKFPVLNGFFSEQLEMPIQGQRLESETVLSNGTPYERSLLIRYAAYPLKEGKLSIDTLGVRANYFSGRGNGDDETDPWGNFFQQFTASNTTLRSDPITIEVLPLPENQKPKNFSGAVGDFKITGAVDKYEVHANEPVTLVIKVEGRGNVSSIDKLDLNLPSGVDLYDSKGQTKAAKGGFGEKIFEHILVPRQPGKVLIPPVELSFFDPIHEKYVTQSTEAFTLNVLEPIGGVAAQLPLSQKKSATTEPSPSPPPTNPKLFKELLPETPKASTWTPRWPWVFKFSVLGFIGVAVLYFSEQIRRRRARRALKTKNTPEERWRSLEKIAHNAPLPETPWIEVLKAYENLTEMLYGALNQVKEIGAKSLSRVELKRHFVEEGPIDLELWNRISQVLEQAEFVQFASGAGAISQDQARNELQKWVAEAKALAHNLSLRG